jgi:hypothetical protein
MQIQSQLLKIPLSNIAAFGAGTTAASHSNINRGGISATLSTTTDNTKNSAVYEQASTMIIALALIAAFLF